MPYYNLAVVNEPGRILSTAAKDRVEALAIFGEELGKRLTLDDQELTASYLLDEWQNGHVRGELRPLGPARPPLVRAWRSASYRG